MVLFYIWVKMSHVTRIYKDNFTKLVILDEEPLMDYVYVIDTGNWLI